MALSVHSGASAQLTNSKLVASEGAESLSVRGRGTCVHASSCQLSACAAVAARIGQGGVVELQGCGVQVEGGEERTSKRSRGATQQTVLVDDGTLMHDAATTFEPAEPTCLRSGKVEKF